MLRARRLALRAIAPCGVFLAGTACTGKPAPITIRLVDVFRPELVLGRSPEPSSPPPRTEWRFDTAAAPNGAPGRGWEAGPGVAELELRGGRLQGRTTSSTSVVHLMGKPGQDGNDNLEEVEIRIR
jgi:hypothetical protein